jgi:sulfatase maturation enzyme AslB (radical SAM superfamily)
MENYHPETYCTYAFGGYASHEKWICCAGTGTFDSFAQVNQSIEIQQLRQALRRGERHPTCAVCWNSEAAGNSSARSVGSAGRDWQRIQVEFAEPKLRHLWIDSGSVCNLACRICEPRYSSSLYKEHKDRFGSTIVNITKTNVDYLVTEDFSQIENIMILGGEPFLNLDYCAVLDEIVRQGRASQCTLVFFSNGTVRPNARVLELLAQFSQVVLYFSTDAVDNQFGYVRTNGVWSQVLDNIQYIQDAGITQLKQNFHITVSALNVMYLDELLTWMAQYYNSNQDPRCVVAQAMSEHRITYMVTNRPAHYSFGIFTNYQQQLVVDHLERSQFDLQGIVNQIKTYQHTPAHTEKFWAETAWTEQYRGLAVEQYLPRLVNILQS